MCPEPDKDELAHLVGNTVQVVAQKAKVSQQDSPLFFDTSLPPPAAASSAFNSDSPHLAPSVSEQRVRNTRHA